MRPLRTGTLLLVVICTLLGSTFIATGTSDEPTSQITPVTGSLGVGRLPGGVFDVSDRLFQFRDYRLAGEASEVSDARLSGHLMSDWNWDVHASGSLPVPAWGTMTIETTEGSWDGAFTGIRRADGEPVAIRALLFGTGPYEGFCATLDITATSILVPNTWTIDGIIHPAPMTAEGA